MNAGRTVAVDAGRAAQQTGIAEQAARRRTFAIISHPDAGKTTLTEKLLLYAGALQEAGSVQARAGRRGATSDWMELERERGISVSSTALQFPYGGHVINLLDTPGHRDFSEDTYRVLAAADAAIMVLDVAKGIEPQTLKLFEVCRSRRLPVLTFLNKCDRPGRDLFELLDEIESQIGLVPAPVTWSVGETGDLRGMIDRRDGTFIAFDRTVGGSTVTGEQRLDPGDVALLHGRAFDRAIFDCSLFEATGANLDLDRFLAGDATPLFVGSALTNFGVRHLLDAVVDLVPAPSPRTDREGKSRPLTASFSGFVFKVQANMNPAHRDHVAFVRVCSGRFERGMTLVHAPSKRPFATKYASSLFGAQRLTVNEAWPGDVVGLVNANNLRIGDTLYEKDPVAFPPIPAFAPELISTARPKDVSRHKQFRRGLAALEAEGVIQVLHRPGEDRTPVLAAVGAMQFEVLVHRLEREFGVAIDLERPAPRTVRRTDRATAPLLRRERSVELLERSDGALLALFSSPYWLNRLVDDHPEWTLEPIVTS